MSPANVVLSDAWDEQIHRLALGLRLVDAVRGGRPVTDAVVAIEDVPRPHPIPKRGRPGPDLAIGLPTIEPRRTGRVALVHPTRHSSPVTVRVFHRHRRYVARRLRIPFPSQAFVESEDRDTRLPPFPPVTPRGRVIALFPGSDYEVSGTTGIRSQVVRGDGTPVPWARVWATAPTSARIEGVAHADDRGEFVLLLRSTNVLLSVEPALDRDVVLHASLPPELSDSPGDPALDPLSSLVIETLPGLDPDEPEADADPDAPASGLTPPAGYVTAATTQTVTCRMGRVVAVRPFTVA